MDRERLSITKRIKGWAVTLASGTLMVAFFLIVLLFGLGQCVGDARDFLACVGLSQKHNEQEVLMRPPDAANPNDVRVVQSLLKMAEAGGLSVAELRVAIVEADIVNAATLGDSTFLLFEGLSSASAGQLDAIMAHEIAHAILEHSEKTADRAHTIGALTRAVGFILGASGSGQREVSSWTVGTLLPVYSRDQELEADAEAVKILNQAGDSRPVDVMRGALAWLRTIAGDSESSFFDSHPSISERIERLAPATTSR